MSTLTKFGELLDKMLDQEDSWSMKTRYVSGGYRLYLNYKTIKKSYTYGSGQYKWTREWEEPLVSFEVTSKYKFDIKQTACLSLEDKQILWPKAKKLADKLTPQYVHDKQPKGEFDMSCQDKTRTANRNKYYKRVLKGVMGIQE